MSGRIADATSEIRTSQRRTARHHIRTLWAHGVLLVTGMTPHPHDALFKAAFGSPEAAAGLLRAVLPSSVAARIDWTTLVVENASFIDKSLKEVRSDLVCTATFVNGGEVVLYVLVEHQSAIDPDMPLRVLGYEVRIWEQFRGKVASGPRPAIVPVVIAHVPGGWTEPTEFSALFPTAARGCELDRLLPDFDICLVDLAHITDDEIRAWTLGAFQQLTLVLLRDARDHVRLHASLDAWSTELADAHAAAVHAPTGMSAFAVLLRYVCVVTKDLGAEAFHGKLLKHLPAAKETVMTVAEELREEGRVEATAEALRTVLAHKFGPLDESIERRVAAATVDELKDYLKRALTADSFGAVFAR